MKIEIVTKNIASESMVREFIQKKVEFALERVGNRVEHVTIRLEDEAGDSESFDGFCHVDASLNPSGDIYVSADGESAVDSVLQAIQKMQNAIVNVEAKR